MEAVAIQTAVDKWKTRQIPRCKHITWEGDRERKKKYHNHNELHLNWILIKNAWQELTSKTFHNGNKNERKISTCQQNFSPNTERKNENLTEAWKWTV